MMPAMEMEVEMETVSGDDDMHLMSPEEDEDEEGGGAGGAGGAGGTAGGGGGTSQVPCRNPLLAEEASARNHRRGNGNGNSGNRNANGARAGGRYPRWSRDETLILIEAKRIEEEKWSRAREEREKGIESTPRLMNSESKWLSIAHYCGQMGASRSAAQCRKRWCNLSADYRRIRDWQSLKGKQSFWIMSHDARKELKLPGCFDHEVFDSLDRSLGASAGVDSHRISPDPGTIFDSGRDVCDDGAFPDVDRPMLLFDAPKENLLEQNITGHDLSVDHHCNGERDNDPPPTIESLASPEDNFEDELFGERFSLNGCEERFIEEPDMLPGRKKKRKKPYSEDGEIFGKELCSLLESSNRILSSHIDSQNLNCHLDRAQHKEHTDSLMHVLGRLAYAFGKVAEKI